MIALIVEGFRLGGVDDERTVKPRLFLETGMAVIPVRARLAQMETVAIGFTGANTVETHAGHTIHVRRQQDAVPVNRGLMAVDRMRRQRIAHAQLDCCAFAQPQRRRRHRTVHRHAGARAPGEVHRQFADDQIEIGAGEHRCGRGQTGSRPAECRRHAADGEPLYETTARDAA